MVQRLTRRFPCAGFIVEFAETSVEEHGGTGDSHVADPFLALIVAWSTPIPRSASTHSLQRVSPLTWPRHWPRRRERDGKSLDILFLTDSGYLRFLSARDWVRLRATVSRVHRDLSVSWLSACRMVHIHRATMTLCGNLLR